MLRAARSRLYYQGSTGYLALVHESLSVEAEGARPCTTWVVQAISRPSPLSFHAALATAEVCVRTTPSSLGLQARPACSANVQSVHGFHATPAICMRRAAPLSSLRASQAQSRDARRETRTLRKRRVKSSCFVWKDLSKRLWQHIMLSRTPEASSRNR